MHSISEMTVRTEMKRVLLFVCLSLKITDIKTLSRHSGSVSYQKAEVNERGFPSEKRKCVWNTCYKKTANHDIRIEATHVHQESSASNRSIITSCSFLSHLASDLTKIHQKTSQDFPYYRRHKGMRGKSGERNDQQTSADGVIDWLKEKMREKGQKKKMRWWEERWWGSLFSR